MPKQTLITRYNLIIKRLQKSPADFNGLNAYLQRESEIRGYDYTVSLRTFQREIKEIEKIGFEIKYNRTSKMYFIKEAEPGHEGNERLLEAFELLDLAKAVQIYAGHVRFEARKPKGLQHFHGLLHAIINRNVIRLEYQKFYKDNPSSRELHPIYLKESRGRWYLIAKDVFDGRHKPYALDRIVDFEINKERFKKEGSKIEIFNECFGVIRPAKGAPQKVRLQFDPFQGNYIKTYPLHQSQKIITDDAEALVIELTLFITHDFIMELLSFGDNVQVLTPKSLRKQIVEAFKAAISNHS